MSELSDAEVFAAPQPAGEMSDADVFGSPEAPRGGANPADLAERGLSVSTAGKDFVNSTSAGSIMRAFGQGFGEAWGPEKLGLSDQSMKWLSEKGIFAPAGAQKFENPFHAFNEGIIVPAAIGLDASWRTLGGVFRGAQETVATTGAAAEEAGVPGAKSLGRDIAAMPEAFMGSLHPTGIPGARVAEAARRAEVGDVGNLPREIPRETVREPMPEPAFTAEETSGLTIKSDTAERFHASYERKVGGEADPLFIVNGDVVVVPITDAGANSSGFFVARHEGKAGKFIVMQSEESTSTFSGNITSKSGTILEDGSIGKPDEVFGARYFDTREEAVAAAKSLVEPKPSLADARELGVIGPEKPPLSEGKPAEAVQARTMAADRVPDEKITQEMGAAPDAWQQRFEQFVGKLEAPEDVKQLIRDSAKENGDFMPARQGDIPLGQVESIAEAAGVHPAEVNVRGLGRNLKNDAEVRVAMQMMLQVTDNVKNAARELKAADTPENLIKLQEAVMRRDVAVEQVVGLRAEWGRTGNVFQEFQRAAKEENGLNNFLKERGRSTDDLRGLADSIDTLDRTQAARLLNDLRTPTAWDKFRYYWVNALISGPITHAKYIIANAAFAGYEAAVVTPVAGTIGAVRRGLTATNEGVFLGEAPARLWGIVAGVPDAMKAAIQAGKTGLQTPLPGEIAQNIVPKQNRNIAFQQRPIEGTLGAAIGLPSRGASAIHSFFNFMGYRASIEAQAYRQAAKEGLTPNSDAFWQRRAEVAGAPTVEAMNAAIEEGYKLTFISELGEGGRKMSSFVNSTKIGQLVMPFVHIPMNILKRSLEGTPAAFLDAETREALAGKHGAAKQDMAAARLISGGVVGAWAINQVLNDRMTGFGPSEPKERAQWLATGHNPYSIRIGDEWFSFNRFGPLGTMLGLYSNLAEAIPHIKPDSEELTKAITMTVHSTGRLMMDEVGMQGLAGLISAIEEPDRKGARFVSNFAGSLLPYSSLLRQTASSMDPYMRETKSVVDGLRYYIPNVRQGLAPKRDWLGLPIANAGYGGDLPVPGASAVIQHRNAVVDPVNLEMKALDLHPARPEDRIHGVKLPAKLYDTYQATAGPFTHQVLSQMVNAPGWHDIPISVRQEVVRNTIRTTRQAAQAAMQMAHPELIEQGVKDRIDKINGVKPTKMKD